jgi:hypothetical protein
MWIPGSRQPKPPTSGALLGFAPRLLGKIISIRHRGGAKETDVVVLGLILLLIGALVGPSILVTIGLILLVVGLVLNFVPIGGTRRRYY